MRAVLYEQFGVAPTVAVVPDPTPTADGVVIEVRATGVCRSDWHGWMGHDPDIVLPHVPGHEFAGVVVAAGRQVERFRTGDRVTAPFVAGCGSCPDCARGDQQVCPDQTQPGFTHWGSFAEYVTVRHADGNLVALPDRLDDPTAASLGCRFATAFRAVVDQGHVRGGQWVAVHGCGGVGLSAVMIAAAIGADVVAVDVSQDALALAEKVGARATIMPSGDGDVAEAVREVSGGGAHVSLDTVGHAEVAANSIRCLRRRGRHVQVGLLAGEHADPRLPMGEVIARELEVVGSHGMQAHRYDALLRMITSGRLAPGQLVGRQIGLDESVDELVRMDAPRPAGLTVITRFG